MTHFLHDQTDETFKKTYTGQQQQKHFQCSPAKINFMLIWWCRIQKLSQFLPKKSSFCYIECLILPKIADFIWNDSHLHVHWLLNIHTYIANYWDSTIQHYTWERNFVLNKTKSIVGPWNVKINIEKTTFGIFHKGWNQMSKMVLTPLALDKICLHRMYVSPFVVKFCVFNKKVYLCQKGCSMGKTGS